MNRVDRLLALILFLQSRRVATAEDMARHFGLSVRTIYRDLAALGEAGVPIAAEAGVGYALVKGYHLPPVSFTPEEASALVTGGMLVEQLADPSLRTQIHAALLKIRATLPRDLQDRMARLDRGMTTLARAPEPPQADLSLLQQALAQRRVVTFTYECAARPGFTTRAVEPMALIHYLARWHLIAWCRTRSDYRDFRTDRMRDVTALRETFAPRDDFDLTEHLRATTPAPDLRARIKFARLSADRAKREWWLGIVDEQPEDDGIVLTLATPGFDYLVGWLLSFGRAATVLAPDPLRALLVQAAQDAAAHHAVIPPVVTPPAAAPPAAAPPAAAPPAAAPPAA
ncbi:helix-turn-helix transcriptional regulator, partial [Chondromyces apiculatus]|uniref:helix-turn-helix transcriptional regulator n=1 Tax=Chondromyces apiculatus TaxID=51 RepID=UPI0007C50DE4